MAFATMTKDRQILVQFNYENEEGRQLAMDVFLTGPEAILLADSLVAALKKRKRSLEILARKTAKIQAGRRAHAEAVREQRKSEPELVPPTSDYTEQASRFTCDLPAE